MEASLETVELWDDHLLNLNDGNTEGIQMLAKYSIQQFSVGLMIFM